MRKSYHIVLSTRQLLLAAIIFVSAAAIITGTILNTVTTTTTTTTTTNSASAASEEDKEGEKSKAKTTTATKEKTGTTSNTSETVPSGSSLPLPTPSTSTPTTTTKKSTGGVVTTQGTLSSESALASTDIVNSVSTTYEVLFTAATTATIAKVLVTFPSGFGVSGAKGLEVSGMGSSNSISSVSISGQTITLNIQSPTSISAGTKLRIEVGNVKNTGTAASNYQVSVTTKRSDGTTIDGPTTSSAFSIRKIGSATISDNSISTSMIKDHAVTGSKIASNTITGDKIAGISTLVFVECIVDSTSAPVGPNDFVFRDCSNPLVPFDAFVVGQANSPTVCFDLRYTELHTGLVRFAFQNECNGSTSLGVGRMAAIVFKHS